MEELIENIEPVVFEKELILDGTGKNYRTLKQHYTLEDGHVIEETFEYTNFAGHPGWKAIKKRQLIEL